MAEGTQTILVVFYLVDQNYQFVFWYQLTFSAELGNPAPQARSFYLA